MAPLYKLTGMIQNTQLTTICLRLKTNAFRARRFTKEAEQC